MYQLFKGLKYLHDRHISHRGLCSLSILALILTPWPTDLKVCMVAHGTRVSSYCDASHAAREHSPLFPGSVSSYPNSRFWARQAQGLSRNVQCLRNCLLLAAGRHPGLGPQTSQLRRHAIRLLECWGHHVHYASVRSLLHSQPSRDLTQRPNRGAHPFDYEKASGETDLYSYRPSGGNSEADSQSSQASYHTDQLVKQRIVHGDVDFPRHVWDNLPQGVPSALVSRYAC